MPYHLLKDSMIIQKSHGIIRILVISKSVWELKMYLKLKFPTGTLQPNINLKTYCKASIMCIHINHCCTVL